MNRLIHIDLPTQQGVIALVPRVSGSVYTNVLNAVCQELAAPRSDLEQLIVPIQTMQVSPRQAAGLLRQAWCRLQTLRASHPQVSELTGQYPELGRLIEHAFDCLQSGDRFSTAAASSLFGQAYRRCPGGASAAQLATGLRSAQAQIEAINMDFQRAAVLYKEAAETPYLSMPLQWWVQLQQALMLEDQGCVFNDDSALKQAIGLYENTIIRLVPRDQRPQDWAAAQYHFGNALGALGQRQCGAQLLERAIEAFENALLECRREQSPLDWASTQNNLGVLLGVLALRQNDTEMLSESVNAFQLALEERLRERVPHDRAATQNNLADMLQVLGQRKNEPHLLKQSVDLYREMLKEWNHDNTPMNWAATLNNLGTSLRLLGEHRKGTRTLEQSVSAYRRAIAEQTRQSGPEEWAITHNNLGAALQKLAERSNDPRILQQSIHAYESALIETDREKMPVAWAMTAANLANARKMLARQAKDPEMARQAVSEFALVSKIFRHASHVPYYELAEEHRASTLTLVMELELECR